MASELNIEPTTVTGTDRCCLLVTVAQSSFQDFGRVGVNWRKRRQGRQRDIHRQRSVVELDPYDRIFAAHRRAREARKARTFDDVRVRVPFVWTINA